MFIVNRFWYDANVIYNLSLLIFNNLFSKLFNKFYLKLVFFATELFLKEVYCNFEDSQPSLKYQRSLY